MKAAWVRDFLALHQLPETYRTTLEAVVFPLARRLAEETEQAPGTLVVGICGPQASGKSTLTAALSIALQDMGVSCAGFSIDDLYLSRVERLVLAETVHPLLATRGPPGTHDVAMGHELLTRLGRPGICALPRFDKAADDRAPPEAWLKIRGPTDIVIFEGWCVGACPQAEDELVQPVNRREAEEDPEGVWRRYVNGVLAGPYQGLFARIDHLALLAPPAFEVVARWRQEQEGKLRRRLRASGAEPGQSMTDAQVLRFVQLYERLTRHILAEMPDRADTLIRLGPDREPEWVR